MQSEGSVTVWIRDLQKGDEEALQKIHERYWKFLVSMARRKVWSYKLRMVDEEDVAQQAFWSFCQTLRNGKLPPLESRHDLMSFFVVITARKAATMIDREFREKRGGGKVRDESALITLANAGETAGLDRMKGDSPLPDDEAILADCYDYYLAVLAPELQDFAKLFLTGCTHAEIAKNLGCSERTVDRKIPIILTEWRMIAEKDMGEGN